ncbi:MAG: helix-turn-helix domain-containing protein [Bacteroidaceae bacterium]|nr:helix-turn-helix domain-containing protein [Bacteroidaceae bacterium]
MLKYKFDVLQAILDRYTSYQIRQKKLLGENALQSLRENKMVGIKALDQICDILELQPGDIIKHEKEDPN